MTARAFIAAAALSLPILAAAGDDVSDLTGLLNEPVVSTASKSAETAGLAPATTSVITSEDIRRYGFTSIGDAINFLGLGVLTERSTSTPDIGARGVLLAADYGAHVLLLVDGHAINEPWDGTAYYDQSAAIPIDLVDHIEVILGPGSVLYGSNAMLGVINVITKRAKDYGGLHIVAESGYPLLAHLGAGYGTQFEWAGHEGELVGAFELHQTWGPSTWFALQTENPDGSGATWGGRDATQRLISVPSGQLRFVLGDFDVIVRGGISKRAAVDGWGTFDDPNNTERDRWLSIDAKWSRSLTPNLRLGVRLYGDLYDYLQNAPSLTAAGCFSGQTACTYQNSGVSRWAGAEVNGTWDWLEDGRLVTLVGMDLRFRHVSSWTGYRDDTVGGMAGWVGYDPKDVAVSAYFQQTAHPLPGLSLNAGLRLDHDPALGNHLSPRVAAVASTWTGGTLKLIYAEAFRAPTFYERFYSDPTAWIAATGLQPETVRSIEGVVEQRLGPHRLRLGGFRTWWTNLVVTSDATADQLTAALARGELNSDVTSAQTYVNAARIDSYGFSLDFDSSGLGQRLRYGAGITAAHSRDSSGAALPAAAEVFGNAHLSYQLGRDLPVLAFAARFVGPRPVSGANATPAPDAQSIVELQGAVSGPLAAGLSYRLAATWSLTDTGTYVVGPFSDAARLPLPRFRTLIGLRYDVQP